jgi:type IV secretory pathway VirB10-like protein
MQGRSRSFPCWRSFPLCAPALPPPPDLVKEEIVILQQQLLELQKLQNETKAKLDEANTSYRHSRPGLRAVEEKQAVFSRQQLASRPALSSPGKPKNKALPAHKEKNS